jgi:DNA-directed RNA polymerase sigma subunit (sigma70/sigma32)
MGGAGAPLDAVAQEAGVQEDRAARILAAGRPARSLQEALSGDDEGAALGDVVSDPGAEEAYDEVDAHAEDPDIAVLLEVLSARERYVIARRFGLNAARRRSPRSGRLGVTRERARQIEAHALRKLQDATG